MIEMISSYMLMSGLLLCLWVGVFLLKESLRREMLILSLFGLFLLPITFQLFTGADPSYTFTQLHASDIVFSFAISGLSAVVFHLALGKQYHLLPNRSKSEKNPSVESWLLRLFLLFLGFIWITLFFALGFDLKIALSVFLSAVLVAIYYASHRKDLLLDAIVSAILITSTVFLVGELSMLFTGTPIATSLIETRGTIGSIPTDLLLWSAGIGLCLGPLYEYIRHFELS